MIFKTTTMGRSYQTEAPRSVSGSNEVMFIDSIKLQFKFFKCAIFLDIFYSGGIYNLWKIWCFIPLPSKRNNNTGSLLLKNSSFKINPQFRFASSASCNVKLIKLNWLPSFLLLLDKASFSKCLIKVTHNLTFLWEGKSSKKKNCIIKWYN